MLSPHSEPTAPPEAKPTTGLATAIPAARSRDGGPPPAREPRAPRPSYELPVLLLIAAVAAMLCLWGIDHSVYHVFYASAVRSMTDNPVAFFYGSFDPGNSITLDKLPGFMWPQALSALLFGFHPWALVLPQAIEMVACVLLLHLLVRRWAGVMAGLLSAAFLALTPVTVGLGRSIVEDAPFVLLLLLAAEATQRAVERARLRTLLLAGVWVGVAFQCKMVEAWAVLPALAVTYLVAAPATLRRRAGHVAVAGVVTLAVSASWMAVATLTPAQSRPYIDGTTDNSAYSMVVGYNFLTRFHSVGVDAASTGSVVSGQATHHASGAGHPSMGNSVFKMFSPGLATQTGWLYPLAALGLVWGLGVLWRRRAARTDRTLAGYLMWGVWLATFFAAFSFGSVTGHTYYMGVVAVALSALSAAGLVRAWRAYRDGGRRAWVLPAATVANVAWCVVLTLCYPHFLGWQAYASIALCVLFLALVGLSRMRAVHRQRILAAGLAAGLASLLLVPAVWSASALSPRYNQAGGMGRVGPSSRPGGGGPSRLTPERQRFLAYLTAHRDGAKYLAAVPGWADASAYILAANASMLPMGGFTGQVPYPTLDRLRKLIDSGELRYVALKHPRPAGKHHTTTPPMPSVTRWVTSHCTAVPPSEYGPGRHLPLLYRCAPAAGGSSQRS
ncbi:glycosyltransferase family 39 protein [Streptomyces sp. TP-A0356]|uniref:ArnT family glycosyltransferase n=1 Tax=Streptomyces sp. TP-A0356 TaxID=1359208 RepID=UPI000AAC7F75|nr:glycosyltransferase family 39 protein [Streptomyces sp. TP-A0356]